ncbi:SDR family NAD(P)-dependent oxidoreductase [Anaeromyxobacter paludicola]|uniref:Short-chain dehydrogenase n=1 Tax=Anaeromyxobacter paludicola TaxID=2918171 RepID=A0ABN6N4D0_9BACT|nr:SDR family NAD(P)-dependent oxidoreductase [Anaeromyxobacter paludicola]BDG06888.1 short-chain dehydrogenase [Anaeromyxobacter paludicola]
MSRFAERYGPVALVAGASAGLGEAFARALAARGLNLLLIARRQDALDRLAAELRAVHGVSVRSAAADLAREDLAEVALALARGAEVGLVVYNAAHAVVGPFLERPLRAQLRVIDVNCRGPLTLAHLFGGPMAARGRGGILLMTSVASAQGNPLLAAYAASKAFSLVLAEGLWAELRGEGVDVLACRAGATRTRGREASRPKNDGPLAEPDAVARAALDALGRGPSVVTGALNRVAAFALGRLLPRRASIRIIGRTTRKLYG